MVRRRQILRRVVLGFFVALALSAVQVTLFADPPCCVQCSCILLCCDPDAPGGCEGGGYCSSWCSPPPCGYGCSNHCWQGGGQSYCCGTWCPYPE